MRNIRFAPARNARPSLPASRWNPAVDILESDNGFTLSFDLPGLERDDITVNVKDGLLAVTGERKPAQPCEDHQYRRVERGAGAFSRSFRMPDDVDGTGITARYEQGVLTLEIPRKEDAKPRLITVK